MSLKKLLTCYDIVIQTDASLQGGYAHGGAVLYHLKDNDDLTLFKKSFKIGMTNSISLAELKAINRGLETFINVINSKSQTFLNLERKKQVKVLVQCDNKSVVETLLYRNKWCKRTLYHAKRHHNYLLSVLPETTNFFFDYVFVPREYNEIADSLSKTNKESFTVTFTNIKELTNDQTNRQRKNN